MHSRPNSKVEIHFAQILAKEILAFFRAFPLFAAASSVTMASPPICTTDPTSLKIALAIALFRLKNPLTQISPSESDAQRWKKKAKERKQEILRLREELKLLEEEGGSEVVTEIASCRCHFFEGCGDLRNTGDLSGDHWIDEVLQRRFLRIVRWKERKKRVDDGSVRRRKFCEFDEKNEIERLSTSIDFLVELADGVSLKDRRSDSSFSAIFHQAVDFILASLKNLLESGKDIDLLEQIVSSLIMRLAGRMCNSTKNDETSVDALEIQCFVQHLLRKLGTLAFVGQHTILVISRKISAAADRMLFMDPFDDAFPSLHGSIFLMIQLLEFLISDNIQCRTIDEDIDCRLLEEWARSIIQTRKGLELLESRNVLYTLYIERVTGEIVKLVGPLASEGSLDSDVLYHLLK